MDRANSEWTKRSKKWVHEIPWAHVPPPIDRAQLLFHCYVFPCSKHATYQFLSEAYFHRYVLVPWCSIYTYLPI